MSLISNCKRRLGFTLIEVLVAMVLMLGLLYIMFAFLVPTLRISARGEARVEMQQQAVTTLDRMAAALNASGPVGVSLSANVYSYLQSPTTPAVASMPIIISVQELTNVVLDSTNQGQQQWATSVVVYAWEPDPDPENIGQGIITERTCTTGKDGLTLLASQPSPVTDPILTAMAGDSSLTTRTLATGVTQLTISYPTNLAILPQDITTQSGYPPTPLTVGLSMTRRAATGSRSPEVYSLTRTVAMRNETN